MSLTFTIQNPTVAFDFNVTISASGGSGYPSEDDVQDGVVFGGSSEYTGNFEAPSVGDVRDGTFYGANGTEFEGTLEVVTPSGIMYQRPILSGQVTSYVNYDDAWNLANNIYDYTRPTNPATVAELDTDTSVEFLTLKENNAFGNTNRFTDDAGGQTYSNSYAIDHLTGLGWYVVQQSTAQGWAAWISAANSLTLVSFSDWRIPSVTEMASISNMDSSNTQVLNYSPFNITSTKQNWTSTTYMDATTSALAIHGQRGTIGPVAKTTTNQRTLYCRNHY